MDSHLINHPIMSNQVHFAADAAGDGEGGGGNGNNANAGGENPAAAAVAANNPAVDPWESLVGLDSLPNHNVAKGLAVKYKDAMWEEVVAPFTMEYHDDPNHIMREIAQAPAAKCVLAVNAASSVQLVYGIRFCHATDGSGRRVLVLGGERLLIAGLLWQEP